MLNDLDVQEGLSELRARAEAALRCRSMGSGETPTAGELQRLIYELEVHKVELELQNEELRAAQRSLSDTRDRYRELYEYAPVAYLMLDSTTVVREANLAAAALLGIERERLLGFHLASLLDEPGADDLHRHLQVVFERQEKHCAELLLHGVGAGYERRVRIESVALVGDCADAAARVECRSVLIDLSGCASLPERSDGPAGSALDTGGQGSSVQRALAAKSLLVVEDDASALSALQELLRSEGYVVLPAASPSEALALSQRTARIDVLLTDVRLPGMSGDALAHKLREQHPSMRVILMSGFPPPHGDSSVSFVQKPIDLDVLIGLMDTA